MTREEQFKRNNDLFAMFMQQILDIPDLAEEIPEGSDVIFLPQSDPVLCTANRELGRSRQAEGHPVTYVAIDLVPEVRTVFVPRLRLAPASP